MKRKKELQNINKIYYDFVHRRENSHKSNNISNPKKIGLKKNITKNKCSLRGELEVKNSLFKDPYFAGKKNPRNAVDGLFNRKASELNNDDNV